MDTVVTTTRRKNLTQTQIIWLGVLGISSYDFQPLLVGAYVSSFGLSEVQAGLISASNMFGVCLGLAIATIRIHRWDIRHVVFSALLLMGFGELASAVVHSFEAAAAVRSLTGFGEGLALAAGVSAVAAFAKPDRIFAFLMVAMSLYGMVGLLALPSIIDRFGLPGAFRAIALLTIVSLPLFRSFPEHEIEDQQGVEGLLVVLTRLPVTLLLVSLMIVYVSCNGLWTYYERFGVNIGMSPSNIGIALSLALLASMIGGLLAAVLGDRFGRLRPVTSGLVVTTASVVVLYVSASFVPYTVSVMLLFGATGLVAPYYMGALTEFDRTGRSPVVGYLVVFIGSFVGPAMAASLVNLGSYSTLMFVAAFLFVVSLLLIVIVFQGTPRKPLQVLPKD
jgi:predicted MFS family arabinose efflux permease